MRHLPEVWDLDSIYDGGAESPRMLADLQRAEQMCQKLLGLLEKRFEGAVSRHGLKRVILEYSDARMLLEQLDSYVGCLMAQDTADRAAAAPDGRISAALGLLEAAAVRIGFRLLSLDEGEMEEMLRDSELQGIRYAVVSMRRAAARRMDADRESLASSLAVDGYHGWSRMYDTLVGELRIEFSQEGELRSVSAGQACNLMRSPSRQLRKSVFKGWEEAWSDRGEAFAQVLNRLAGFRLALYREREWESLLEETLEANRASRATLDAMWGAVEKATPLMAAFLQARAERLGLPGLSWFDLDAPLPGEAQSLSLEEAARLVTATFEEFSPKMGTFAREAIEAGWVESQDRDNKAPGAFCTDFPVLGQSRVFTTFGGDLSSAATLAHELGHAWHGRALRSWPYLARLYPMTLAETASTFAERLVSSAAMRRAETASARLAVADDMAREAVGLLMNIRARFLFETRFYAVRTNEGPLPADRLSRLMEEAQREAYGESLCGYHPLFWCSKLHFYDTTEPFYNWPYTFGFLFSMGVWAQSQAHGESFEERYLRLLQDTGSMSVEDLAEKHLEADITRQPFWNQAIRQALAPVEEATRLLS